MEAPTKPELSLEDFIDKLNALTEDDVNLEYYKDEDEEEKKIEIVRKINQDLSTLLQKDDFDINSKSTKPEHGGATLLHAISRLDIPDLVLTSESETLTTLTEILLYEDGIDVNVKDDYGNTPLMISTQHGACFSSEAIFESKGGEIDLFDTNNLGLNFAANAALYGRSDAHAAVESIISMNYNKLQVQRLRNQALRQIAISERDNPSLKADRHILKLLKNELKTSEEELVATKSSTASAIEEDVSTKLRPAANRIPILSNEEFDEKFIKSLPSYASYIGATITSTSQKEPTKLRETLSEAMANPEKRKIVIALNLKNHFTGFVIDKGSESDPAQITYFDPAPIKPFLRYHRVPGNLIQEITNALPDIDIKRSKSKIQPPLVLGTSSESFINDKSGPITHFALCGLVFDKAQVDAEGFFELFDLEGNAHKVRDLSNPSSLELAQENSRFEEVLSFVKEDLSKKLFYERSLNDFIDKKNLLDGAGEITSLTTPKYAAVPDLDSKGEEEFLTSKRDPELSSKAHSDKEIPKTAVSNPSKKKPNDSDLKYHRS